MTEIVSAALLLGMAPPSDGAPQQSMFSTFLMFGLIFLVFYFLIIAPARKKQKAHTEMISSLKNGDRVITQGGIHGTVVGVSEQTVQLRVADNVKLDFARNAIAAMQSIPGE